VRSSTASRIMLPTERKGSWRPHVDERRGVARRGRAVASSRLTSLCVVTPSGWLGKKIVPHETAHNKLWGGSCVEIIIGRRQRCL